MPAPFRLAPCLFLLIVATPVACQATTVLFPSKDNTIYASSGTMSNGAGDLCFAGTNMRYSVRRALVAFPVSGAIPAGSQIVKVELRMEALRTAGIQSVQVSLHNVLADWGEAGSQPGGAQGQGAPAQTGDATWSYAFYPTARWTNVGGDFGAVARGSVAVSTLGAYTWTSTPQMVGDVQRWLDQPTTNFGWLLRSDEVGMGTAKMFGTKEAATVSSRPQLVVSYVPRASVTSTGVGCTGSGSAVLRLAANGQPTVPSPGFALSLTGGPSGVRLVGFTVALLPGPVPVGGGCSLYVDPAPILILRNLGTGMTLPLPIANQPALLGIAGAFQGAVGDSITGFLTTSNALVVRLGT